MKRGEEEDEERRPVKSDRSSRIAPGLLADTSTSDLSAQDDQGSTESPAAGMLTGILGRLK